MRLISFPGVLNAKQNSLPLARSTDSIARHGDITYCEINRSCSSMDFDMVVVGFFYRCVRLLGFDVLEVFW